MPDERSLRNRLPDYAAVFGVGILGAFGVGLTFGLALSDVTVVRAIGYSMVTIGLMFLLVGGATGGGYVSLNGGAVSGRADSEVSHVPNSAPDRDVTRSKGGTFSRNRDPMQRLRLGLRPRRNPTAFWQVIGGVGYIVIGAIMVTRFD